MPKSRVRCNFIFQVEALISLPFFLLNHQTHVSIMSLKFGLNAKKGSQLPARQNALKKQPALSLDDSDEDSKTGDNGEAFDASGKPVLKSKSKKISQFGDLSSQKTHLKNAQDALEVDASIYDYDAAFDAIHAKDAAKKAAKQAEAAERKAKYMDNLLASADIRKQNLLRAQDKKTQREREAEGDEFADKEKFVTGAYKLQQEEVRKAEAEEKIRQEKEEKKRKELGMAGFYRSIMDDQDKRHQEAIAATAQAEKSGLPAASLEKEKTDIEIAEEAKAKGTDVVLNEDGQIVDKRQLLTAGLNIIKKPKSAGTPTTNASIAARPLVFQGKGSDPKARRERESRMLEAQLEQATKRAADEEAEEQRKLEHAAKSRKTEGEIGSAKERYLARKKAAEEAKKKAAP
jgi:coiled-coil domain-containing protein 55